MAWDPQLRAPLRAWARSSPLCQPNAVGKFLRVDPGPRATPRPPPAIALRGAPPSAKPQCAGAAEPSAMATRRRTAPQIHTAALVARPGHQAHPFRDTVGWARPRTPVPHGLALRREQFRDWIPSQSRVDSEWFTPPCAVGSGGEEDAAVCGISSSAPLSASCRSGEAVSGRRRRPATVTQMWTGSVPRRLDMK